MQKEMYTKRCMFEAWRLIVQQPHRLSDSYDKEAFYHTELTIYPTYNVVYLRARVKSTIHDNSSILLWWKWPNFTIAAWCKMEIILIECQLNEWLKPINSDITGYIAEEFCIIHKEFRVHPERYLCWHGKALLLGRCPAGFHWEFGTNHCKNHQSLLFWICLWRLLAKLPIVSWIHMQTVFLRYIVSTGCPSSNDVVHLSLISKVARYRIACFWNHAAFYSVAYCPIDIVTI